MGKHTKVRVAEAYPKWLLLSSLVISSFATQPPLIITGLLLTDIGLTFGYPVGAIGQIRTMASVVSVIIALLMGARVVVFDCHCCYIHPPLGHGPKQDVVSLYQWQFDQQIREDEIHGNILDSLGVSTLIYIEHGLHLVFHNICMSMLHFRWVHNVFHDEPKYRAGARESLLNDVPARVDPIGAVRERARIR